MQTNIFNIKGNRASLQAKLLQSIRSKPLIKSKSKEPQRQLKPLQLDEMNLQDQKQFRALTTNKKLLPLMDEPDSARQQKVEEANPFRHNVTQLLVLIGKREYYFDKILKDELHLCRGQVNNKDSLDDAILKVKKFLSNKVRYKYRQVFKMQFQIQLELLKYNIKKKSLNIKSLKDVEMESDEENTPKKKKGPLKYYPDYTTWKKKNDVYPNQKVFIIRSGYHDLRDALINRGWIENEDPHSPFFDLKWTCALRSDDYVGLFDYQMINHFDSNQCLCSKYGLCRNIRCIQQADYFFPRCYDLGDLVDFNDFVEDFKISKTHSILIEYAQSIKGDISYKQRYRIRMSLLVQQRVNKSLKDMIKSVLKDDFLMVHPGEWLSMLREPEKQKDQIVQQQMEEVLKQFNLEDIEDSDAFHFKYSSIVSELVQLLNQKPQSILQGPKNIWIIKPEYSSRGRGIKCFDDLYSIFDHIMGREMGYVAQKYIEHPLIIKNRKFDIRQWVIVTELVPLKIYFYNECYIRFSAEEYDAENLNNKFAHLTNNAIAKFSSQFHNSEIKGNMWSQEELITHLIQEYGYDVFMEKIQPKMKEIVIHSLRCCSDQMKNRKKSFEVYGYDFMIDSQFNPWLIEVNMSPSSDTSTPVTSYIIPKMMEDIAKVIVDYAGKSKKKIGGFQLIYNSDTKLIL